MRTGVRKTQKSGEDAKKTAHKVQTIAQYFEMKTKPEENPHYELNSNNNTVCEENGDTVFQGGRNGPHGE